MSVDLECWWMALTGALLAWMFDGLEMGLFALALSRKPRELIAVERARFEIAP